MAKLRLRPEVVAFAQAMEQKLRENDYKGGWKECSTQELFKHLEEEVGELKTCVESIYDFSKEETLGEAADVANIAMMLADVYISSKGRSTDGNGI